MTSRRAVLSMDIEDWYHLEYMDAGQCDRTESMLDGLDNYTNLLDRHKIPSSFFVLGELVPRLSSTLVELRKRGHDIGSHGPDHVRPMTFGVEEFATQIRLCREQLQEITGGEVLGYRAPCFSLDRERLERLRESGFKYDSSRILFGEHPLYEVLDVEGFEPISPAIHRMGDFFEFQVSTQSVAGREIPVSGGGYLRIFPWLLMKQLLRRYLSRHQLYVLYIHPFELSTRPTPRLPQDTPRSSRLRFAHGRAGVGAKLERLIELLKANGFEFSTFASLRSDLLAGGT
jgi:polysaccharide deacetylase family protein (PEP-CTERM system associated)